jgi:VanZ family protein
LPAVLWGLVIFFFSSKQTGTASEVHWQDFVVKKTAHMVEYAIFAMLLYRALTNTGVTKKKALVTALLFCILYGFTDEYHQSFTPGREPHIRDVVFDTIGASISVYSIWKLLPTAPEKLKNLARSFQLS